MEKKLHSLIEYICGSGDQVMVPHMYLVCWGGHMASWLFVIDCIQPKLFLRVMSQFRASVVVKTTASNKSNLRQC